MDLRRVERVAAADDDVILCAGGREHLAALTLAEVAATLAHDARFVRVHRSHLVNLDHVAAVRLHDARRFAVVMRDGVTVVASRAGTRLLRGLVR